MSVHDLPDPSSHMTGWDYKFIEGKYRVGMRGNLDTVHDAVISINSHSSDRAEAKKIAEWIVEQYNSKLNETDCHQQREPTQ